MFAESKTNSCFLPRHETLSVCKPGYKATKRDRILPDGVYKLKSHRDGGERPPTYGLRLDGLLTGNAHDVYTFSFDKEYSVEVDMKLSLQGGTVRIYGTAYGGLDIGTKYDPTDSGLWEIDFTYDTGVEGDDDLTVKAASAGKNKGTITQLYGNKLAFNLVDFAGSNPYTFRLDNGHRRNSGVSGWGWLNHAIEGKVPSVHLYASDWLFEVHSDAIETYPKCEFCDTYRCPANSVRKPRHLVKCYDSFNDCVCKAGYKKIDGMCKKCFDCPAHSRPKAHLVQNGLCAWNVDECEW